MYNPVPAPAPVETSIPARSVSIGVPASSDPAERRFPLTPEGAALLVERGYRVLIEEGAGGVIHYTDAAYTRRGAEIVSREETLRADIVIHIAPLALTDARRMRRGAMLLTMLNINKVSRRYIDTLLEKGIITIAIDLIRDDGGNLPFADILDEIAGRAAVALSSALLADSLKGKGILLGGVAGIVPCEVAVIGSSISAVAAARSAIGLGAMVRMFDNDIYSLRTAVRELDSRIIPSALHRDVLDRALASADVIILTPVEPLPKFTPQQVSMMKKGVITFDLTPNNGDSFPGMTVRDTGADGFEALGINGRICYTDAANAVPRTAAMALSNTFVTMFSRIMAIEGCTNALSLSPGLQCGCVTFLGKLVNSRIAAKFGLRSQDISLFIQLS